MPRFALALCALIPLLAGAEPPKTDQHGDPLPAGAIARLGTMRWRVGAGAHLMQFLADGMLLTVSDNLMIQVWDVKTGRELRHFDVRAVVSDVPASLRWLFVMSPYGKPIALSDDGQRLAFVSTDMQIHLVDTTSGRQLRKIGTASSTAPILALSPDGSRLAELVAGQPINRNTTVGAVWNTVTGERVKVFSGDGDTARFFFSAQTLFSADGKSLYQLGIAYGPNGNPDWIVNAFDLSGNAAPRRIELGVRAQSIATGAIISPHRRIAAVPAPDSIRFVNLDDGKELGQIKKPADAVHYSYIFGPGGKTLIHSLGPDGPLTVWEVPSGKVLRQIDAPKPTSVTALSFTVSPDGKTLAWSGGPVISLVDLETSAVRNPTPGHTGALREALFSADGRAVMTRSTDGIILRWDPATGKEIGRWEVPTRPSSCQVTPDQNWILANVSLLNRSGVTVYGRTMKELRRIAPESGVISSWGIVPDSKSVCFTSRQTNSVVLHDIATGQKRFEARLPIPPGTENYGRRETDNRISAGGGTYIREVFSRDGRLLGVVSPGFITVWDTGDGRQIGQVSRTGLGVVRSVDLPVDESAIAVDSTAGVGVWELATGSRRFMLVTGKKADPDDVWQVTTLMFPGALHFPSALAFAPDGRLLARAGDDGVIRVWDVWTGTALGQFNGHRGAIVTLTFSPDGGRLVSTATDSTAVVWDARPMSEKLRRSWSVVGPSGAALWATLLDADAGKAFEAMRQLAGDPDAGVTALRAAKRSEPIDAKTVDELIVDLSAPKFATRDRARAQLERLCDQAMPALQRLAASSTSTEAQRAAQRLLERLNPRKLTAEQIRGVRAVEVLERIGTPAAMEILKNLATGAEGVAPTPQARAALRRLDKK